jgi:hypothetical protein
LIGGRCYLDELTFRPAVRQRLGSALGAGICLALTGAFAVIAWLVGGLAWTGATAFGLAGLAFLGFFMLSSRNFTVCDGVGIRCRVLGRHRTWTWSEIEGIEVRAYWWRGTRRSVTLVVLHDGDRVVLPVPANVGAAREPVFAGHVEQIREYWRRSSGQGSADEGVDVVER